MDNDKKKIGVYQTGEYGAFLFEKKLHKILLKKKLDEQFQIVRVTPRDVAHADFLNDLAGLAMPGRNSGQQYRDEWGEQGYKNLKTAVEQSGMNILAVCAASAVLCREVSWYNSFQPAKDNKYVYNEHALFNGKAIGAFDNLWRDGYRSVMKNTRCDEYHSNILAAKVLPVQFAKPLIGDGMGGIDGHALYWGGCVFYRDFKSDKPRILVQHQHQHLPTKTVLSIPVLTENNKDIALSRIEPKPFLNPEAVIEFDVGKGQVIFSNIHPEIDSEDFAYLFHTTPQARNDKNELSDLFLQDKNKMVQSDIYNSLIFERFVENCTGLRQTSLVQTVKKAKKELAAS